MTVLAPQLHALRHMQTRQIVGSVDSVRGLSVHVSSLPLAIGSRVRIEPAAGTVTDEPPARGEVIGFQGSRSVVMLFDSSTGIGPGNRVVSEQSQQMVQVGRGLLGRVVDGLGRPMDGARLPSDMTVRPVDPPPTSALMRRRIDRPLPTGVAAIDSMLTLGKGQRVGVFAGPGVGKSTLLASIARHTSADVNVIALIGERGREVRDFLESALGEEGRKRSVVVVATGDESPLLRVRAAMLACAAAEHFRDLGADVMLMMDSITRFAQAQRQIGLAVGEQPATKGYTPSVFATLPRLLERAGTVKDGGSITGLYAVLVEGDDLTEPISDAARGILDGHIALSRKLASRGHFPAIDILESISRVGDDVCDEHHIRARRIVRRLVAAHAESEELINIGAYAKGSNASTDVAIAMNDAINGFLQQDSYLKAEYPQTCRALLNLAEKALVLERQHGKQG